MPDVTRDQQLVTLARSIERLAARRRKMLTTVRELDDRLRVERKHLRDLTTPQAEDFYETPPVEEAQR